MASRFRDLPLQVARRPAGPLSTVQPVRERLLRAAYESIARFGLGKTSVDDVARIAKVSRATVYRHFPGGKDELIRDTVMWETAHVVEGLRDEVSAAEDLEAVLVGTLVYAFTAVSTHEVLRKVLETEPERILPALLSETPWLVELLAGFLVAGGAHRGGPAGGYRRRGHRPPPGSDDPVVRHRSGGRNLADEAEARDLVRIVASSRDEPIRPG